MNHRFENPSAAPEQPWSATVGAVSEVRLSPTDRCAEGGELPQPQEEDAPAERGLDSLTPEKIAQLAGLIRARGLDNYRQVLQEAHDANVWRAGLSQHEGLRAAVEAAALADLREGKHRDFSLLAAATRAQFSGDAITENPAWQEAAVMATKSLLDRRDEHLQNATQLEDELRQINESYRLGTPRPGQRDADAVRQEISNEEKTAEDLHIYLERLKSTKPFVRMAMETSPEVKARLDQLIKDNEERGRQFTETAELVPEFGPEDLMNETY